MGDGQIFEFADAALQAAVEAAERSGIGPAMVGLGERTVSTELAFGALIQAYVDAATRLKMQQLAHERVAIGGVAIAQEMF